jgi:hypothetical protein
MPVGGLLVLTTLLAGVYGACMGVFALVSRWGTPRQGDAYYQLLASTAKVPMLFLFTLAVTLPSLYVFNALVGSRLGLKALCRMMVATLAIIMAVLASFGTILVFFSLCTESYSFIVLLNVAMFAVAGLLGMRFLLQTLHRLSLMPPPRLDPPPVVVQTPSSDLVPPADASAAPAEPYTPSAIDAQAGDTYTTQVLRVFRVWIVLFGVVGAQMGWVLRPFIGSPNTPFSFFREREGNFLEAVVLKSRDVLAGESDTNKKTRSPRYPRLSPTEGATPATAPSSYPPAVPPSSSPSSVPLPQPESPSR